MAIKNLDDKIRAYALKNAVAYGGKANPGAVVSALFNEGLEKSSVKDVMPKIQKEIREIGKLDSKEQKKELEKMDKFLSEREVREGLPELPNVSKGIRTRFAPSPSGALHIGHAATLCVAYAYVKKYGGKLYVRIEDTNPENIFPDAYKLIEKDAKWLTEGNCVIIIQSDRMELYYKYAEKLMKNGHAYVCTCTGDDFREFVKKKKDCPCRELSIKENQQRWKDMLAPQAYPDKSSKKISTGSNKKGFSAGEAILRFKTPENHGGMTNPNPAMRDFPLARINETKHPRQKNKYRVWPLMNLSVAVDDMDMKLTHIISGKDHRDNAKRQEMIYEVLGKEVPWTGFQGKWKFSDLELSSSKITEEIKSGKYSGWDDPKLPTVSALKKKGYTPEAFLKLAENRGLSEVDKVIDKKDYFEMLDNFNKK